MSYTNTGLVIVLVCYLVLISVVAQDLGLTSTSIVAPDTPESPDGGLFDAVIGLARWVFNAVSSFFQLLTFQVDVPSWINSLLILPVVFGVFYLILVVVRGGAS